MQLPDPEASRAVVIGASSFDHLEQLPAVKNNVAAIARCLTAEDLWGLPPRHVVTITDPTSSEDILDAIYDAAEQATDTLLVYYAGHGLVDRRSNLLLAVKGSVQGKHYTATSYESIRDLVVDTRAPRRIAILDCCYSGRALGTMSGAHADPSAAVAEGADAEGTFVLAAAAENRPALAPPAEQYTAFTGELVALLEEGRADGPRYWDLDSIYRSVRAALAARARPEPQKRDRNSIGALPIARNRAKFRRPPHEVAVGSMFAERYEMQRLIAVGGTAAVWEAVDHRLGRRVAVKILKAEFSGDDEFIERFRTEARAFALINHPGVVAVHEYGVLGADGADRVAYLVMELVDGESLEAVLEREGRLALTAMLNVVEQVCWALKVVHDAGLVHRHICPGNILVTSSGQAKLADFGIAKAAEASTITQTGMVMGDAWFIAPEAALGEPHVPASDLYSLGVICHRSLTGQLPFDGDGAIEIAMKHIMDPPPDLPGDTPAEAKLLVKYLLVKNPAGRYGSASEVADAVAAVRGGRAPAKPNDFDTSEPWPSEAMKAHIREAISEVLPNE